MNNKKTILLGCDHNGVVLKENLKKFLTEKGYEVKDFGAHEIVKEDNYPEILTPLAFEMSSYPDKYMAIVIGKSGQGEAMVCNRFPGVRAMVYYGKNKEAVELSRKDNDSNVLSLGAEFLNEEEAKEAVSVWLNTEFSNAERHAKRIEMLDNIN